MTLDTQHPMTLTHKRWILSVDYWVLCIIRTLRKSNFWACPYGSGFPFQVLAATLLWAFHCNPSRNCSVRMNLYLMIGKQNFNILFVCTVNRMRSATAHKIFEEDKRFNVKSAGTDVNANTVLTQELLDWSTAIIVMEKHHRSFIRKHFPQIYNHKKIVCFYIPDDYDYMQQELIYVLKEKMDDYLKRGLLT